MISQIWLVYNITINLRRQLERLKAKEKVKTEGNNHARSSITNMYFDERKLLPNWKVKWVRQGKCLEKFSLSQETRYKARGDGDLKSKFLKLLGKQLLNCCHEPPFNVIQHECSMFRLPWGRDSDEVHSLNKDTREFWYFSHSLRFKHGLSVRSTLMIRKIKWSQ